MSTDHGTAPTQDEGRLAPLRHHPAQRRIFPTEPPALRGAAQDDFDLGQLERLGEVIVGAEFHGLDGRRDVRVAREDHHFYGGVGFADSTECLQPPDPRHLEVQQNDVELLRPQTIEGIFPAFRTRDRAARPR
jgi:hypothetical protein